MILTRVAKLVAAKDLKSFGRNDRTGSSPVSGITLG